MPSVARNSKSGLSLARSWFCLAVVSYRYSEKALTRLGQGLRCRCNSGISSWGEGCSWELTDSIVGLGVSKRSTVVAAEMPRVSSGGSRRRNQIQMMRRGRCPYLSTSLLRPARVAWWGTRPVLVFSGGACTVRGTEFLANSCPTTGRSQASLAKRFQDETLKHTQWGKVRVEDWRRSEEESKSPGRGAELVMRRRRGA